MEERRDKEYIIEVTADKEHQARLPLADTSTTSSEMRGRVWEGVRVPTYTQAGAHPHARTHTQAHTHRETQADKQHTTN